MIKYGDVVELPYTEEGADKYIANTNFDTVTTNYNTPNKQRQLFEIENE